MVISMLCSVARVCSVARCAGGGPARQLRLPPPGLGGEGRARQRTHATRRSVCLQLQGASVACCVSRLCTVHGRMCARAQQETLTYNINFRSPCAAPSSSSL